MNNNTEQVLLFINIKDSSYEICLNLKYSKKVFNVVKYFCNEKGCSKCVKSANNVIWWVSFWKFVRGLLPENDRLHRHFGKHFLNFDARTILST